MCRKRLRSFQLVVILVVIVAKVEVIAADAQVSNGGPYIKECEPGCNYVDPREDRDGATNSLVGEDSITITFSESVRDGVTGGEVDVLNFQAVCQYPGTARENGCDLDLEILGGFNGENPSQVEKLDDTRFKLHFPQRFPLGARVTIRAFDVVDSNGNPLIVANGRNRAEFGFNPGDISQDGIVNGIDYDLLKQYYFDRSPLSAELTKVELLDIDRTGIVNGADIDRIKALLNGTSATYKAWLGSFIGQGPPLDCQNGRNTTPVPVLQVNPQPNLTVFLEASYPADPDQFPENVITGWKWSFEQGSSTGWVISDPTRSHQYSASGTYQVTVMMLDYCGAIGQLTQSITVDPLSTVAVIDGRVLSAAGTGLSQVVVRATDAANPATVLSATTDAMGTYRFENVPNGPYYMSANKTGYDIVPSNFTNPLWVSGSANTGQNFAAAALVVGANPSLVKDIISGSVGSMDDRDWQRRFVSFDGRVYFSARSDIWKTDGTEAGTVPIKTFPFGHQPEELVTMGTQLYFALSEQDSISDPDKYLRQIWKSDGSTAGTQIIRELNGGTEFTNAVYGLTPVGTSSLFFVYDNNLYKTNGTAVGTILLQSPFYQTNDGFVGAGNHLYWSKYSAVGNGATIRDLRTSDGTVGGTGPILPTVLGAYGLFPYNNQLFFSRVTDPGGAPAAYYGLLWKTGGTPETTVQVKDVIPARDYAVLGSKLYFSVRGDSHPSLWQTDGTTAGTIKIHEFANARYGTRLRHLTTVGNNLYCIVLTVTDDYELWISDGTDSGTRLVKEVQRSPELVYPGNFTEFNSKLYFSMYDEAHGIELWQSDGTAAGTKLVRDINPNGDSSPSKLLAANGALFFVADDGIHGRELWKLLP